MAFRYSTWAAIACMAYAAHATAVPGDEKTVTDIYGHREKVRDSDDELPTFQFIGTAYQAAAYQKEDIDQTLFALVKASNYDTYLLDRELSPFLALAKTDRYEAIVFLVSESSRHGIHAVFFRNAKAAGYSTGGIDQSSVSAETLRKSLVVLPEKLPVTPGMGGNSGAMRLRPGNIYTDNGKAILAYKVMHVGKPEIPWSFGDKPNASANPSGR